MTTAAKKKSARHKAFREVPYSGVLWVVAEATKLGFYNGNPEWSNFGQGQPEIGEMKGAPRRIRNIRIEPQDQAYGPLGGSVELREKIAAHYNRLYRKNHTSKYSAANVSLAMGGKLVLTRIFAALDKIRLGYCNPEYPAYEDMMNYHEGKITPVSIPTTKENGFATPAGKIADTIKKYRLNAFLSSNPCNPTGKVIAGDDLHKYVKAADATNCTMIFDEFYSHFIYDGTKPGAGPVSAAAFINDVNKTPVLIIDGLTKSFRYPGWRLAWVIGPADIIETINRVASAVDGGPSQPITRAALQVLDEKYADKETIAIRKVFSRKRNIMIRYLHDAGVECMPHSSGTFYLWGDISKLPRPINTAERFFYEALKHKVMTIPGYFFDLKISGKKKKKSEFDSWIRFSFGPPEENLVIGLERLTKMIQSFRNK